MFDDILDIGTEIAVGTLTGAIGAKVGKEIAGTITDDDKDAQIFGSVVGGLAGSALGLTALDSFDDEE